MGHSSAQPSSRNRIPRRDDLALRRLTTRMAFNGGLWATTSRSLAHWALRTARHQLRRPTPAPGVRQRRSTRRRPRSHRRRATGRLRTPCPPSCGPSPRRRRERSAWARSQRRMAASALGMAQVYMSGPFGGEPTRGGAANRVPPGGTGLVPLTGTAVRRSGCGRPTPSSPRSGRPGPRADCPYARPIARSIDGGT